MKFNKFLDENYLQFSSRISDVFQLFNIILVLVVLVGYSLNCTDF